MAKKSEYKNVLMITPIFKIKTDSGKTEKLLKKVKEFLKNGWKPIILTIKRKDSPSASTVIINNEKIKIFYFPSFFSGFFSETNSRKYNKAKKLGRMPLFKTVQSIILNIILPFEAYKFFKKNIKKEKIDLIYGLNLPNWPLISGALIKKDIKKPLITEFRDAWTENKEMNDFLNIKLEKYVVKNSNKVITYNGGQMTKEYFVKTHDIPENKIVFLPYLGFMPDDYKGLKKTKSKVFTISYGGTLEGEKNPKNFIKAVHKFIDSNDIEESQFKTVFMGDWHSEYDKLIKELKLEAYIKYQGRLSHKDYLKTIKNSDVLLLLIISSGKKNWLSIPSKTWEYIAIKNPILLLAEQDWESSKFIIRNNLGLVANPNNINDIAEKIQQLYEDYNKKIIRFKPSKKLLSKLDRTKTIKEFCKIMDNLIKNES